MLHHLVTLAVLAAPPAAEPAPDPLPLPLFEAPRSLDLGFRFPTWEQARSLHHALIVGGNHLIHVEVRRLLANAPSWMSLAEAGATVLLDLGTLFLPLGQYWVHEEGHASAMAILGLRTQQAYNPFSPCDPKSVCGLTDEQIAAAHDRRAADWVRVQEAGMETELLDATWVERDVFFHDRPAYQHSVYLLAQVLSVEWYRQRCVMPSVFTMQDVQEESLDVTHRDFTGPDCTGWVYDLFRPSEPYADRGPHPLGGLRRTRLDADLSPEEFVYLGRMRTLGLLNLVDPFLYGLRGLELPWPSGGPSLQVAGAVRHHLTESGDLLEVTLLARREPWNVEAALRAYSNQAHSFPGLALRLHRFPLRVAGVSAFASGAVELWVQPSDHDFFAATGAPGGAIRLEGALPVLPHGEAFLRLQAKTQGWLAGDPSLDPAVEASLGVAVVL